MQLRGNGAKIFSGEKSLVVAAVDRDSVVLLDADYPHTYTWKDVLRNRSKYSKDATVVSHSEIEKGLEKLDS